jgi:ATP-dependent RNA helicase SUPV3L1/SUV3
MPISFSPPSNRDTGARGTGVTAVLGPTNTGKTHLAIERMLGHSSGIIGLPLRLLAREVYNRCVERMGADAVALVTGEEKIKPANPRFWVSTVEAMPRDLDVAFVAIDEVQLGADLERGHVFTDRMLNRRGREETLVLGAATVRPMVERLLPGAHVLTRPRLSQLTFAGEKKLTRLPRRSAVVTFSAEEVYAIAELIRRQRGGAAVVMGALSPRTRNAQVALYQSGDVDYLVATDAIGMGLNLDVDHVAFASDRKFDGYQFRRLNPAELAQIAGRAGRAMRDGTFGTTGRCPPFETEVAQALESHSFEPIKMLQWRNTALDFSSLGALQASLAETPKESGLTRAPIGEDILVLEHAIRDDDIRSLATTRQAVERLWDVCQIPDYRKISPATHAELATTLYGFLMREGAIPTDWFAQQVEQADKSEGDIDTLSNRIAHIRTWTFAANRPDWLADPGHWQEITRAVEDRLSDALHERLTERFVDRRTSVLMRRLRENTTLETDISKTGDVAVEGHNIGRIDGFMFTPDTSSAGSEAKTLAGAAQKALAGEINARATRLSQAAAAQFALATDGTLRWLGQPVAKLVAGEEVLKPRLRIIADEHLTGAPRDLVQVRLDLWLKTHIERLLGPLFQLLAGEDVTGITRGVAFQLVEGLGVLERQKVADEVKGLDQPSRAMLRKYGVRFGAYHIYVPALIKPGPRVLATQLWALKHAGSESKGLDTVFQLAGSGRTSIAADKEVAKSLYRIAGYRVCGERAVRIDILERLADVIRPALAWREGALGAKPPGAFDGRGFTVAVPMTSLVGCAGEDFASILRSLGYRMEKRPKPAEEQPPAAAAAETAPAEGAGTDAILAVTPAVDGPEFQPAAAPEAGPEELLSMPAPEPAGELPSGPPQMAESLAETALAAASATDAPLASPAEGSPAAAPETSAQGERVEVLAAVFEQPSESASALERRAEAPALEQAAEAATGEGRVAKDEPDQPQFIDVWRPGRLEGPRRQRSPQHLREAGSRRERHRARAQATGGVAPPPGEGVPAAPDAAPAEGAEAGSVVAGAVEAGAAEGAPASEPRRRHRRRRHVAPDRADAPSSERPDSGNRPDRSPREDRPGRSERAERPAGTERADRPRRSDRGQRSDRGDRPDRDPELRAKYIKGRSEGRDRRDPGPDPNSPFAKLAALKAQLEANTKEPR